MIRLYPQPCDVSLTRFRQRVSKLHRQKCSEPPQKTGRCEFELRCAADQTSNESSSAPYEPVSCEGIRGVGSSVSTLAYARVSHAYKRQEEGRRRRLARKLASFKWRRSRSSPKDNRPIVGGAHDNPT